MNGRFTKMKLSDRKRELKAKKELKEQIADSKSLRDSLLDNITVEIREDCWINASIEYGGDMMANFHSKYKTISPWYRLEFFL